MNNKLSLLVNFVGVDKMSGALRNIVGLGKKGSNSLRALQGEGRRLETQLRKVRSELGNASGNVTELANRERELESAISGVNRQMDRQKGLNALEGDRRAMLRRGEELKSRGRDNMVQGASIAAPLILATKAAADFSSGMVDIQQKAGLTNREADRLQTRIMTMSKTAKQMPEDIRSGLDLLLAKGMGLDAATAAIGPAGRLATAYKVEIPDAASAAYSSINNLKVPASQTARIFDIMAAAGNEGAFEVKNMARHFPALTAQMQALGEKGAPAVADLSAALQVAMHTAGSEDEAGNNIANLLAKINAPGTISKFKQNFGVDLPAAMKKLTDEGYSSLEAIAMITDKATGGDTKKLGFAFEDQQARMGLLALIQNMDEYRRVRKAAMNSGGTVDAAFDQRVLRDASVSWSAFMGSVSSLAITLGTTLLPVLTSAANQINVVMSRVSAWAQANPAAAATIIQIVGGLAMFKIGLGLAQFALGGLLGPLSTALTLWRQYRILGSLAAVFPKVATGVRILGIAFRFMLGPVGLVITILGVLGYAIYANWDKIKAAFASGVAAIGQAWDWIKQRFLAGVNFVMSLHGRMANIGKNIVLALARGIMSAPGAVWNALKSVVTSGIARVKNLLGIKSPSRVFMAIGGQTAEGMALGIRRRGGRAVNAAGRLAAGVTAAGSIALTPLAASAGGSTAARTASATATQSAAPSRSITINVYGAAGQDTRELAREIKRELDRLDRTAAARSYEDEA